jgi:hypothetical protein
MLYSSISYFNLDFQAPEILQITWRNLLLELPKNQFVRNHVSKPALRGRSMKNAPICG